MNILGTAKALGRTFKNDTRAAIAIAFALMAPVIVGAAGMALDYSQAYLVQQRLSQALDAAALSAAASSTDPTTIEARVRDFFAVNYPESKLGVTFEPVVLVSGDDITVTGTAHYDTSFLRIIGINSVPVEAITVVRREIQGIEVALVLDVTGSMATNNNIGTLRTAATSFVNILFNRAVDPDLIKIGLVPYSTAVNVGPYGLGYDVDGNSYGAPFVNNPNDLVFDQSDNQEWHGCVEASSYPLDTQDHDGPWDQYRFNCGGALTCEYYYRVSWDRNPNNWCNKSHIIPLSSDQDLLLGEISQFQAEGSTLGNLGMIWGYRVLSPEAPFEEGSPWDNRAVRRAVVMMTDGQNSINNFYSAYGPSNQNDVSVNDLNDRFSEICEAMKNDHNVTIYTVTFASGVNESTKQFYRDCASSEDQYFDAPDQSDLIEVFETIGRELSNIHLSR